VPAGKYHRLAAVRHRRDRQRERERSAAFPYRFDFARADRFFRFAEKLRHYKGEWAGRFVVLEPHQKFRLGSIFAWVHRETGLRRFRTAYNEIPRKNGKSLEAAIVALYVTFFDREPGAEGYCVATKRDQAKIVFNDCRRLVLSSGLRSRIAVLKTNLHRESTSSKLEPLGADRDSTDGLNPHLVNIDEAHALKHRGMVDVMETATGARRQALINWITTAGDDLISPCGDQHVYGCNILDGVLDDETVFVFIAHADPGDDWTLERTWRKANPNYGVSVKQDDMRALATKAVHMTTAAASFKQKRLNLWINSSAPWLSLDGWRAGQTEWTAESMRGERCWLAVDMSSKIDLTAVVAVFPPTPTRDTWRVYAICLTPADTLTARARRDRAPYPQWVEGGYLRTCPGNRIDQDAVVAIVAELKALFDVQGVGVDPWNAGNLVKELGEGELSLPVIEVPQNVRQMSAPSKDFEADVLDGLVDGGTNPLLAWCAANVVVDKDKQENIFPTKKRSRGRIDPIVAAIIGVKVAGTEPPEVADDPQITAA
jgi:phage terminase large subunit-like protein